MRTRLIAFCAVAAVASRAFAAPEPLAPKGSWVVDFADAQCIASRNYATPESPLYLFIKAPPLGDVLQIGIAKAGYITAANQMDGEIGFDEQQPLRSSVLEFGVKSKDQTVLLVNLPRAQLAPMHSASSIRIHATYKDRPEIVRGSRMLQTTARELDYRFKVTQIPALLDMLDKCAADLRKVWNVEDGDGPPALVRERPKGDLRSVFSDDDYPGIALRKDQTGSIRVAVLVNEHGKVADCTVVETSGVASLDAQSCALIMQRAQLRPATGLDGKPAKGALLQKIGWQIDD